MIFHISTSTGLLIFGAVGRRGWRGAEARGRARAAGRPRFLDAHDCSVGLATERPRTAARIRVHDM